MMSEHAVGKVTAQVAIDERPEGLLKKDMAEEARIEQLLDYRHKHVKERLAGPTSPEERKVLLEEDQTLEAKIDLHDQLRTGGLKEPFFPGLLTPMGPNLLQFNLQQSYLPNPTAPP